MSDGMAFLTGAAFAGVAVLFMLKGGGNLGATNLPVPQQLPVSPATNPYNPYLTTPQSPLPASPDPALFSNDQQRVENDRLKVMLEQQRTETEQLKAQLQSQQMLIERLSGQTNNPTASPTWSKPLTNTPQNQQQPESSVLSGIVWGLGGMAVTISGGLVVVGALAVLSRQQQRPARTTYVVQQPYTALPPSGVHRRRAEVITPIEERHVDYVDYDR